MRTYEEWRQELIYYTMKKQSMLNLTHYNWDDGRELIYLHWDYNIEPVLGQVALWNRAVVAGYCNNKRNA